MNGKVIIGQEEVIHIHALFVALNIILEKRYIINVVVKNALISIKLCK
jgi:hypothetical protein